MVVARVRGWGRRRRIGVTAAVVLLAVLVAGLGLLTWPVRSGASGGSAVSVVPQTGGATGAPGSADRAAAPAPEASAGQGGRSALPPPGMPVGATERQLVRTAQLTVRVDDTAAATRQLRTAAVAAGGLVVQEQSGDRTAWLVLRVPADSLDRVIDDVAAIGAVTERTGQVVDSTAEVVDLDARVASQQASVARVRALLAQATAIGEVVAIESELARREADLDSLTNRLAALRDQVAMSALTVDLRGPTPGPIGDDDRATGFTDGLAAGWSGLLALGTATAAVLGFVLPFLPVLAVLLGLTWVARRTVRGRRVAVADGGGGRSGPASGGKS